MSTLRIGRIIKTMNLSNGLFILLATLATLTAIYPILFVIADLPFDLFNKENLQMKYKKLYYTNGLLHIIFGSVALFFGWIQFIRKLRLSKRRWHQIIGRFYVFSVVLSSIAGMGIAFFTDSVITSSGFISLGLIWLYTTLKAFISIKKKDLINHQEMMIYSYAACFAAVTLRLWQPLLVYIFADADLAYRIVAWWCWIPNLSVAGYLIHRRHRV